MKVSTQCFDCYEQVVIQQSKKIVFVVPGKENIQTISRWKEKYGRLLKVRDSHSLKSQISIFRVHDEAVYKIQVVHLIIWHIQG